MEQGVLRKCDLISKVVLNMPKAAVKCSHVWSEGWHSRPQKEHPCAQTHQGTKCLGCVCAGAQLLMTLPRVSHGTQHSYTDGKSLA